MNRSRSGTIDVSAYEGASAEESLDVSSVKSGGARALGDALASRADRLVPCVHCGFCLPACPTYNRLGDENDSPRGRLHLMRAVVEGRLAPDSEAFQTHIDRCLGCRACESACPSGVEYGQLLEVARTVAREGTRSDLLTRVVLWLMARPTVRSIVMLKARAIRASGLPALIARIGRRAGPYGPIRLGAAMLAATGSCRLTRFCQGARVGGVDGPTGGGRSAPPPHRGRVAVLAGCVQAGLFGRVGAATVRTLEANGYEVVEVAGQGCCGALHSHGGDLAAARSLARANISAFEAAAPDWVAVDAAGCGAAMKEYPELFTGDEATLDRARSLATKVRDATELLAQAGPRRGAGVRCTVAYDHPCHLLHAQGVRVAPLAVLEAVPGLEVRVVANADECCGGAGIYGITQRELGGSIGADKVAAVRACSADLVATPNPGCIMQIGAGLRLGGYPAAVAHPIELLDTSYLLAGYYPQRSHP